MLPLAQDSSTAPWDQKNSPISLYGPRGRLAPLRGRAPRSGTAQQRGAVPPPVRRWRGAPTQIVFPQASCDVVVTERMRATWGSRMSFSDHLAERGAIGFRQKVFESWREPDGLCGGMVCNVALCSRSCRRCAWGYSIPWCIPTLNAGGWQQGIITKQGGVAFVATTTEAQEE